MYHVLAVPARRVVNIIDVFPRRFLHDDPRTSPTVKKAVRPNNQCRFFVHILEQYVEVAESSAAYNRRMNLHACMALPFDSSGSVVAGRYCFRA